MEDEKKKEEAPEVKDLTKVPETELNEKETDAVAGGYIVGCGPGHNTCKTLHITVGAQQRNLNIRA